VSGWGWAWLAVWLAGAVPCWLLIMRIWIQNQVESQRWDQLLVIGATGLLIAAIWPIWVPVLTVLVLLDKAYEAHH
jgi:hypothetical protein